ncbi:MAG: SDR family oxidoreductase [Nostoc sp.]|uniref:SDR family oxidoreductase n=1 Tax=Nostoc sp. TaxID=1180 RepID=UPI002FFBCCCA
MNLEPTGLEVAIIGMAGRFPGGKNIDDFWKNLVNGVELVSELPQVDMGLDESNQPNKTIKAAAVLEGVELFDASFFGYTPREAETIDPQQRLFLECAWEALENAGYDPEKEEKPIGVYAGSGSSSYLPFNLDADEELMAAKAISPLQAIIGNDKDFVATRVSYKLNLNGPSINVGTACSTSLVATHLACQSLLSGECNIALAGGITITVTRDGFVPFPADGMVSPDGHCRAFDAKAQGTVFGNGLGVVVLKRLESAIADGDQIYAVIKGSAINNDGSWKIGYTAPSEIAQAKVIRAAQIMAEVEPDTISYIEAHGSGTTLGDPIEMTAMIQAFRASTDKKGYCAVGSVKTNVGHLGVAAGMAGLIKTVLSLKHKLLPPSLNFAEPNPQINFENSPFYVNTELAEWLTNDKPRRAGVSSFGLGGTNAHVILEEAPRFQPSGNSRPWQLLLLSAKTSSALNTATANLAAHLKQHPDINLADVASTLQLGRQAFKHRRAVVCQNLTDAVSALQDSKRVLSSIQEISDRPVAFMFTGLGTHYVNMTEELYQLEPTFQKTVAQCCEILKPILNLDLRDVIYPKNSSQPNPINGSSQSGFDLRKMLGRTLEQPDAAAEKLNQTYLTQPAIFVIEYALAQLWISWGIRPVAMIGYSIGEYVAATLAGVLSLEDALTLVAKRAQMIQELPSGAMLAVPLSEAEVRPLLSEKLSLSAINGAKLCVVAGDIDAIDELAGQLTEKGLACRRLQTSHAFHSYMMEAIADPFTELVKTVKRQPVQIPYLSNVTGTWITADQATDANYWTKHLCQPVRFGEGVKQLWRKQNPILLEVGPGQTLSSLALQYLESEQVVDKVVLPSLRYSYEQQSDLAFLLNTLGQLWLSGVQINWSAFYAHERRHRIPLPTYPFERQRYWIDRLKPSTTSKKLPTLPALWQSMVEAGQNQAVEGVKGIDTQLEQERKLWLTRLCAGYMNQTIRQLGAFNNPEEKYTFAELFEQCQIIPRYRELLTRWLNVLLEAGHIQRDEAGIYTNLLPVSPDSMNTFLQEARLRSQEIIEWVDIYQRYGENLPAILTGARGALEFHFSVKLQEEDYTVPTYPTQTYYKPILRAIVEQVVKPLPANVNLRILELGAGTGTATEELLPLLPQQQTKYTFTDLGSLFLKAAKNKFSAYPFVEYGLLDIEKSPQEQGYSTHNFDVIIAFNVLHVARNIGATLEHVRSLLAPGGFLILWEITEARLEADIMDAVLMNPIEDETGIRNMGNPFLSKEQWQEALTEHGFVNVAAFSEFDVFGEHIILAQASASPLKSVPAALMALIHQEDASQVPSGKKPEIADWFYVPSWKRSMLPPVTAKQTNQQECYLIFVDESSLGEQIVQRLELQDKKVITVRIGEQFAVDEKQHGYTINPQQQNDYHTLFQELSTLNLTPKTIVHLWSVTPPNETILEVDEVNQAQDVGFYSLLFIAQVLEQQNLAEQLQIMVISNNMQSVTGDEILSPQKATVLAACKVIPQEYPNISCRSIDVVVPSGTVDKLVDSLLKEISAPSTEQIIAYRNHHRWVQNFEKIQWDVATVTPQLRDGGVYLITGGLGNLGLLLAEYLARTVKGKLILIGRSILPNRDDWSNSLLEKVLKLEALGAEVLLVGADVTNQEQMQSAIAQAETIFGKINGVIHAAGISGKLCTIEQATKTECEQQFAAKVHGLLVLAKVLESKELDFCLLMSSLSSVLGGRGLIAYSAANLFMDAFVHQHNQTSSVPWVSVDWDTWQVGKVQQQLLSVDASLAEFILTPQEGIDVLERILSWKELNQVFVSTGNLTTRLEQATRLKSVKQKVNIQEADFSYLRPRPNLKNEFIAPTNELENKIAESFKKFLGFDKVGIYDSFFALGGDSLTGSVMINQLRDDFQIEVPVRALFEAPTVAELSLFIEKIILEELEELTDEEVQATLEKVG